MRMASSSAVYDVVVVGAGIMGSCTAYEVAKRGHTVLLLEQFDFLHRRGSSHGETRIIRVSYPEEYYTRMMKEAFKLWEEAQNDAGYRVHTQTCQLDLGHKDNPSLLAVLSSCQNQGIDVEVLDSPQVASRFPLSSLPQDLIGLVTAQGGILHASKAVAMFQMLAAKHGAVLRDRSPVTKISPGWKTPHGRDAVLVTTGNGSFLAHTCVVTAGAWTSAIVKEICGLELPIVPLHTTIAYWRIQDDAADVFSASNGFPSFASYGEPFIYGNASVELPGLIKVNLDSGHKCDPNNRPLVPDIEAMKQHVSPWLQKHFQGKVRSESPVLAEACMYSMTPDHDFIIDFLPPCNGGSHGCGDKAIVVAGGFSGHGFKMSPLVGRILADLCLNKKCEGVPLELFSISRFAHNPGGNRKSFGQVMPCNA